jgi:putative ABC transport system ATP-binding protein
MSTTIHSIVKISHLNYFYGLKDVKKQVLFDVTLNLEMGKIIILTGPSGSGKTTLLTLIGALRSIQEGSLKVMDQELLGMKETQLMKVRQKIGFIFQSHNLFPSLTALENVKMALEMFNLPPPVVRQKAEEILTQLGLGHRLNYKPEALSGGQKQRVAIARALVNHPHIILADEPTAALDKKSAQDVVTLIQEIVQKENKTILMVTHDNRLFDIADRLIHMVDGRLQE